ncbi:hypothetical protein [Absidia glauca]|uniref:Uncharacterized protein n=1 Tax=Absidia glauca TaxID=4829 RepID=A0A163TEI8_ABSGL|nr:hypothetical protein [Absidia glauca]
MMEYKKRMESYAGDDEELVVARMEADGRRMVLVTHDEPTFYANDDQKSHWLKGKEQIFKKKGQRLSVMVSEFRCPCHGTMRLDGATSRKLFFADANRDGYWTSKDMVDQLTRHTPIRSSPS